MSPQDAIKGGADAGLLVVFIILTVGLLIAGGIFLVTYRPQKREDASAAKDTGAAQIAVVEPGEQNDDTCADP